MNAEQIKALVAGGRFPGQKTPVELVETHISWVILTPDFAFKIKKPVQFPFLDFSTPEKRAFCCREEIRLNRRLAPALYLDVLPIRLAADGVPEIGSAGDDAPIDYAVFMRRLDNSRQMDELLRRDAVTAAELCELARILVRFHRAVALPGHQTPYRPGDNRADFDDLFRLETACAALFGPAAQPTLDAWREQVGRFLTRHESRLHVRARVGFWVDGHGDLHARNIFLLPEGPVVFDCIEFNPHFRQVDVLSELAFLCMELDAGGHHELAEAFMAAYLRYWPCIEGPEDEQLFLYFKAYRANVRLKVALTEGEQHPMAGLETRAKLYWDLLGRYLAALEQ